MAPVRVLQIVPAMDCGGMETFIMNLYRNIDRDAVQFDFLYHYARSSYFDEEIEALGGRIYRLSVREDNNFPKYFRELDAFFAQHPEYTVIHGHYAGFGVFYNHYAKKHGVRVRIGHSHNTRSEKSLTGLFDAVLSAFFKHGVTEALACGRDAGRALYGARPFEVWPNGIDVARFAFDAEARHRLRMEFGLADAVIYGHIGRFTKQKNHAFLIEIFAELAIRQPAARLLLVGEGPLQGEAREKAVEMGVADRVVFAGLRSDTPALYSAMDCFLLPSLFEGLPVVLVEAQAGGLPCFVSDAVSPEAALTPLVRFLPLDEPPRYWAEQILAAPLTRRDETETLRAAGYDIVTEAKSLQALYLKLAADAGEGAAGEAT